MLLFLPCLQSPGSINLLIPDSYGSYVGSRLWSWTVKNPNKSAAFKGKLQWVLWLTKHKHWKGEISLPKPCLFLQAVFFYGCSLNGNECSPGREFRGIISILGVVSEVSGFLRHTLYLFLSFWCSPRTLRNAIFVSNICQIFVCGYEAQLGLVTLLLRARYKKSC